MDDRNLWQPTEYSTRDVQHHICFFALIVVYGNVSLQDLVLREVFHLITIQVMLLFNV